MKLKPIFLASMLAFASHEVLAGDFYTIPNTSPSATLVGNNPSGSPFVSNNSNSDRFYIPTTGVSWVSGFEDLSHLRCLTTRLLPPVEHLVQLQVVECLVFLIIM